MKQNSRYRFLICAIVALMFGSGSVRADTITYDVNEGPLGFTGGTIVGTVQTDGLIGTLAGSDFLTWDLLLSDGAGDFFTITPENSSVTVNGTATTATSSSLLFNFGSSEDPGSLGYFEILDATDEWGWLFATPGNQPVGGIETPNPDLGTLGLLSFSPQPITLGIASESTSPEPSSFVLLLSAGLGIIGIVRHPRRSRQRS